MQRQLFKTLFLTIYLLISGGINAQEWSQIADMGDSRYRAVSFTLSGRGYVTVGQTSNTTKRSTWEYDPIIGMWSQKADFGGGNRRVAMGFAINDKGYVGTGRDDAGQNGNGELHNDFWEYDAVANIWTQKANFPGGNRETATAFNIGEFGYAGLGLSGSRKYDFYKYDPTTNSWTVLQPLNPSYHLYDTTIFTLNGNGYYATGSGFSSNPYGNYTSNEVIRYEPQTDTWTKLNNFAGGARQRATAFTVNGTAYLGLGWTGVYKSDLWQYNEAADTWTQIADFPSPGRAWVSKFVVGNNVFVGNGVSLNNVRDDFYIWEPSLSNEDVVQKSTIVVSTTNQLISFQRDPSSTYDVTIFGLKGDVKFSARLQTSESVSEVSHNLSSGIYLITISNLTDGTKETKKIHIP